MMVTLRLRLRRHGTRDLIVLRVGKGVIGLMRIAWMMGQRIIYMEFRRGLIRLASVLKG
jgi:hypothetical protein